MKKIIIILAILIIPNLVFGSVKTQVIYYDAFKSGKNCKKTALFHDCKNLPN